MDSNLIMLGYNAAEAMIEVSHQAVVVQQLQSQGSMCVSVHWASSGGVSSNSGTYDERTHF